MITLTLKSFADALVQSVKDKPMGFKYECPPGVQSCLNFHPPAGASYSGTVGKDWTTGCLIGTAVVNAGVSMETIAKSEMWATGTYSVLFNRLYSRALMDLYHVDADVIKSLARYIQSQQDSGKPWAESIQMGCDRTSWSMAGYITMEQLSVLEALHKSMEEYISE